MVGKKRLLDKEVSDKVIAKILAEGSNYDLAAGLADLQKKNPEVTETTLKNWVNQYRKEHGLVKERKRRGRKPGAKPGRKAAAKPAAAKGRRGRPRKAAAAAEAVGIPARYRLLALEKGLAALAAEGIGPKSDFQDVALFVADLLLQLEELKG